MQSLKKFERAKPFFRIEREIEFKRKKISFIKCCTQKKAFHGFSQAPEMVQRKRIDQINGLQVQVYKFNCDCT